MPTVRCAWWNLHSLFPFVAAKTGKRDWPQSEESYSHRLGAIAEVLSAMPPGLPDLLMFCEVATRGSSMGRSALADLADLLVGDWEHYLCQGGDTRGMTTGAMWNRSMLGLHPAAVEHRITPPLVDAHWARPILELPLVETTTKHPLTLFLNHWTSPLEGSMETQVKRIEAARTLITLVQRTVVCDATRQPPLAGDPDALVVAVGDFNDEPHGPSLTDLWGEDNRAITRDRTLALARLPALATPVLYNASWRLLGEAQTCSEELRSGVDRHAGTYLRRISNTRWEWHTVDQVLLSAGTLRGPTPVFDEDSLAVHYVDAWFAKPGVCSGPSDHLPVAFSLNL
jgi:hypothetical protein